MASLGAMLEDAVMLFEVPLAWFWPLLSLAKALRCASAELLERVPPERTHNRRSVQ